MTKPKQTMNGNAAIPCVDFEGWAAAWEERSQQEKGGGQEALVTIARDLTNACRSVGFAYVVNHGISDNLLAEAFSWSKKFFDLPLDKKMSAPHPPGPDIHRGYSWPGLEKVSQDVISEGDHVKATENRAVSDVKESYEIGSEQDKLQPNVWLPNEQETLPGFRDFMNRFYWQCFETSKNLLRALAIGLELAPDEARAFVEHSHRGHNNQLRLLHYPPIEKGKLDTNVAARMPAHSDWGTITLLFQENDDAAACDGGGSGLQVEDPNESGKFLDAIPQKGALIMNVGDLLMRWSNDTLKSTLHRVVGPPPPPPSTILDGHASKQQHGSSSKKEGELHAAPPPPSSSSSMLLPSRYSIPYFVAPEPDTTVKCLSSCTSSGRPAQYEPITQDEYRRMRGRGQY